MSLTACLAAYSLRFVEGGAYAWVFLNWALGLRDAGWRVLWLDSVPATMPGLDVPASFDRLRAGLAACGFAGEFVVVDREGATPPGLDGRVLALEEAASRADLFVNLGYDLAGPVVSRFRRSAFVDIDPGLTQVWIAMGALDVPRHDVYFTYGETVGRADSPIPSCGLSWHHTAPPIHLPSWPVTPASPAAPYTTVTSWWNPEAWVMVEGAWLETSKRTAFLPYVDLPARSAARLEVALPIASEDEPDPDVALLRAAGWRVRAARDVSRSPDAHRGYVRASRGEFSVMKRGYRALRTAWTGERALNYLASGRPVVIEDTGPSRFLPDAEGLVRFRDPEEAARRLAGVEADYDRHSRAARAVAEACFDARPVVARFLEIALG